jgi:hypothetical protein
MSLWKMNREHVKNEQEANLATKNQLLTAAEFQLKAAQTRTLLPQEKLRAQQAIEQIQMQKLQNNMVRGLLTQGGSGQGGGGGSLSHVDPSHLVPEMVKDPAERAKVYEEIRKRQNIARNGQAMLDAFEEAVKQTSGVLGATKSMLPNFSRV